VFPFRALCHGRRRRHAQSRSVTSLLKHDLPCPALYNKRDVDARPCGCLLCPRLDKFFFSCPVASCSSVAQNKTPARFACLCSNPVCQTSPRQTSRCSLAVTDLSLCYSLPCISVPRSKYPSASRPAEGRQIEQRPTDPRSWACVRPYVRSCPTQPGKQ
jgi:hypothetical protein